MHVEAHSTLGRLSGHVLAESTAGTVEAEVPVEAGTVSVKCAVAAVIIEEEATNTIDAGTVAVQMSGLWLMGMTCLDQAQGMLGMS